MAFLTWGFEHGDWRTLSGNDEYLWSGRDVGLLRLEVSQMSRRRACSRLVTLLSNVFSGSGRTSAALQDRQAVLTFSGLSTGTTIVRQTQRVLTAFSYPTPVIPSSVVKSDLPAIGQQLGLHHPTISKIVQREEKQNKS